MVKPRFTGETVPTSRVFRTRSVVYTKPKIRYPDTKSERNTKVVSRRDVQKYLAWLDS